MTLRPTTPPAPTPDHEIEGLALFATHGLADAGTTALAALTLGPHAEGNPLMATLLQQGVGFAVGAMLLVVGLLAVAYPWLASWADLPRWFSVGLSAVGALVALGNVLVVMGVVA